LAAPPKPDNLTRIEGIGPKISSVLQEAGITTFAQLADTTPDQIEQILEEADPRLQRLAKPETWPEQAALAASGEWEALEALQKGFKAGRRA
jgi:predicted flap endonuclease-1-like 5' DNA nuclease